MYNCHHYNKRPLSLALSLITFCFFFFLFCRSLSLSLPCSFALLLFSLSLFFLFLSFSLLLVFFLAYFLSFLFPVLCYIPMPCPVQLFSNFGTLLCHFDWVILLAPRANCGWRWCPTLRSFGWRASLRLGVVRTTKAFVAQRGRTEGQCPAEANRRGAGNPYTLP